MDQIAPAVAWIKKNIFWLGCFILFLAMVVMWYMTTTSLAKEQGDNETKVKSTISTAQAIMAKTPEDIADEGVSVHPNDSTQEGMKRELSETLDAIVEAWKLRVEAQKEILVWPSVIENEAFNEVFEDFNPPETFPAKYDTRVEQLLTLYRTRIQDHMLNLCGDDLLRTNWKYDPKNQPEGALDPKSSGEGEGDGEGFGTGLGAGRGGGMRDPGASGAGAGGAPPTNPMANDLNRYAVIWSDINQELWYKKLTTFQGIDDHNNESINPTPLQCYMLQQDLWLLEAMFRIIRGINGNSNANDLSVIKQLDHIAFGREANATLGELTPVDPRLAPGAQEDPKLGPGEGFGDRGSPEGDLGDGGSEEEGFGNVRIGAGIVGFPPFHNRYVDLDFKPISSEQVLQVIRGQDLPDTNLELIIAKRVPFRIAVKMDERRIGDFMAACANSPFAFEIQQVRVNRHKPGGEDIPLGGYGNEAEDKLGGMGISFGDPETNQAQVEVTPVEVRTNYDVYVEFYGVVKIYNPVREDFLRQAAGLEPKEDSGDDPAAQDATAAAIRQSNPAS